MSVPPRLLSPVTYPHTCYHDDASSSTFNLTPYMTFFLPSWPLDQFLEPGRSDLVSGCAMTDRSSLHDRFVKALQQHRPDLIASLDMKKRKAERLKV